MNIKLIAPHCHSKNEMSSAETFKIQRLNLSLLAAVTPVGHTVTIADETFGPDNFDKDVDLVGITVMTDLVPKVYRLADRYRRHGVKVVMGGIHPTVMPGECLEHADSVIVGEAEEAWPRLVSHAASGQMHRLYRTSRMMDLKGMPHPRRDLYPKPKYKSYTPFALAIEASRGCPYDCEFCSIGQVWGHRYRFRPVPEVIAEIKSIASPYLFFVDDTLGLNRTVAKRLFTEMIPLRRIWVGQGAASLAEDLELLTLMKRSGCLGLLIGFESVQKEIHSGMKKIGDTRIDFSEAMHRFHGEGIAVLGAFSFGFDQENKDVFDQTLDFVMKYRLTGVQLRILVPFPGTRLYKRLLNERRLFVPDWWLHGYSSDTLLFHPKAMTPDELLEGLAQLKKQIYSSGAIMKRFFGMSPWKRTATGCRVYAGFNLATRKRYLKDLNYSQALQRSPDSATRL